jgi:hypothetical protein
MSRNSKNARLIQEARARKGQRGPSRTEPKHGKVNVKYKSKEVIAARTAILSRSVDIDKRTVLEKMKGEA